MRGSIITVLCLLFLFGSGLSAGSEFTLKGEGEFFVKGYGKLSLEVNGYVKLVFTKQPKDIVITPSYSEEMNISNLSELLEGVDFSGEIEFKKSQQFTLKVEGEVVSLKFIGSGSASMMGKGTYNLNGRKGSFDRDGKAVTIGKVGGGGFRNNI